MAVNPYTSWFSSSEEQGLYDSSIVEIIKLFGYEIWYLPKESVANENLFGEDVLARFPNAIQIEAYIENVEGFGGAGEVFSKFGIEINDQITFLISRTRFEEVRNEGILDETGFSIMLETADPDAPGPQDRLLLEEANSRGYDYTSQSRPNEGDLIFFPLVNKLFEIKFVEHEKFFYSLGRRMVYQLKCELYQSSSERIDTGVTEIDAVEDVTSTDILGNRLLLEDGTALLLENGGYLILENVRVENVDPTANNELLNRQVLEFVDFTEWNPISGRK